MEFKLIHGDSFFMVDEINNIDVCFTSPNPCFYSKTGTHIGSEPTVSQYIMNLVDVFRKLYDRMKDMSALFVHMTDSHDEYGRMRLIPEIFAMEMSKRWTLRSKLTWHRSESGYQEDKSRFRRDAEPIYYFTKYYNSKYFNPKFSETSVFSVPATTDGFPPVIIDILLSATCPPGGTVLDPFCGTGGTGKVAMENRFNFIGIDIDKEKLNKCAEGLKYR